MAENQEDQGLRLRIETTPREAYEFVQKLAHDENLRSELGEHPETVLTAHGIHVSGYEPQGEPRLPPVSELEELAKWMERLQQYDITTVIVPATLPFGPACMTAPPPD